MNNKKSGVEIAVFGGGCFWCTEAVFKMLKGVRSVTSGYASGKAEKPSYQDVSGGQTGHAEVVQIEYNPAQISYHDLLTVFFASHDPTQVNRQGPDVGSQYRSIILYTSQAQKKEVEDFIQELESSSPAGQPIATEVIPLKKFYEAEDYHRDYYAKNPDNPYCQTVINPKLKKVKEKFAELLRRAE